MSFTNDIAGVGEVLHIAETQYLALKEALDGFDGTNEDSIDPYSDKVSLCVCVCVYVCYYMTSYASNVCRTYFV